MSVFWYKRDGKGLYSIGLGQQIVVQVTAPDDALASQWAQCCAAALNARERALRNVSSIDAVYRADGTLDEVKSFAAQAARDKYEANAS